MKPIPYGRQSIHQDDIDAVVSVLSSDWLTQGPKVREFEAALCRQTGAKHCVVVANGTMALHFACLAFGVGPGDAGLTSPISFMASANCIAYCGATPDFADIDPQTLCLSVDEVRDYCKKNGAPKVVIPVDFAGVPADLPRFKILSEQFGFKLLEDAAHAIGSTYSHNGREYACGSCAHTDMAILSFHPVKTITTGEGGAVLTNDDELADRVRHLTNHGIERIPERMTNFKSQISNLKSIPPWYHEMQVLGFNGRITDIQCALGLSQLKRLADFKARRQDITRTYNNALKDLAENQVVVLPPWPEETDPCFHIFPLRLGPSCLIDRDRLFEKLKEKGVHCQVHYIPIYRQPFYQEHFSHHLNQDRFPESESYFKTCISLPLYPGMEHDDQRYVIDTFRKVVGH